MWRPDLLSEAVREWNVVADDNIERLRYLTSQYTDRGGCIRLTIERQGSDAVVSVTDNGIGIAADHLARLFEMFSQAAPALSGHKADWGLGCR